MVVTVSTATYVRTTGLVAALLFVSSFFIPVAETISGYQAFLLSLQSWGTAEGWQLGALPIVLSWLANLGAVFGLATIFFRGRSRPWLRRLSLLGLLSLGPLIVDAGDLLVGYYVWATSIVVITVLALFTPAILRAEEFQTK